MAKQIYNLQKFPEDKDVEVVVELMSIQGETEHRCSSWAHNSSLEKRAHG
jgi:hypothetical protein